MAEHRDLNTMSKVLDNVEEDLKRAPPLPAPAPARASPASASVVESFAPQKYRNTQGAGDSMEQIQQDFRKSLADLESRFKALMEELKRVAN